MFACNLRGPGTIMKVMKSQNICLHQWKPKNNVLVLLRGARESHIHEVFSNLGSTEKVLPDSHLVHGRRLLVIILVPF